MSLEWMALGGFGGLLLVCMLLKLPLMCALAAGLCVFLLYGRHAGFGWRALFRMCLEGVRAVKNILIVFFLIGILTALWRASGTIPLIVCRAARLIRPRIFLLAVFLLNCGVSVLTGTSFGTAATMGVICATMGNAMGVDVRLTGGAILSGAFFGDRCSPVSTSALLVAELTKTNIYDNLRGMLRTAFMPFLMTCGLYGLLSARLSAGAEVPDLEALFASAFALHWIAALPAVVMLGLAALRVNVRLSMAASIAAALPICLRLQGMSPAQLLRAAVLGYHASVPEVAVMIDGGGVASMLRVAGIVCLSSSFSGIFRGTGLLDGIKRTVARLSARTTPFAATLGTAALTAMLACNQTLTIMLTHQLCGDLTDDPRRRALALEDSAVVVAPLAPWSIAGAVPLAAVGALGTAVLAACFLYLLPLWRVIKRSDSALG